MTYKGTVKNGVVILPPEVELPEGAEVNVTSLEPPTAEDSFTSLVRALAQPRDWPDDLAANHDYYLHGNSHKKQPRKQRWIAGDLLTPELTEEQAALDASQLASMV